MTMTIKVSRARYCVPTVCEEGCTPTYAHEGVAQTFELKRISYCPFCGADLGKDESYE